MKTRLAIGVTTVVGTLETVSGLCCRTRMMHPLAPRLPQLAALATLLVLSFASSRRAQQPDTLRVPLLWKIAEGRAAVAESVGMLSGIAADNANGRLSRFEASAIGPTMADWMSDRALRFTADGGLLHPKFNVMISDSIAVPSFANAPRSTVHA